MSQLPAMPVWVGDFYSKTYHLTREQKWAYLDLLMKTWVRNCSPFPDDPKELALVLGMTVKRWLIVRPKLEPFFDLSGGTWRQENLEKQFAFVAERASISQRNGSRGGRPVSNKIKDIENPAGLQTGTQTEPTHTQTQNQKEGNASRSGRARETADQMLDIWRVECGDILGNPTKASDSRIKKCSARLGDHLGGEIENWRSLCQRIRRSWYLTEKWKATIDWVLEPGNMLKIQEGNYDGGRNTLPGRASAVDNLIEGFGRAVGLGRPSDSEPDWSASGPLLDGEHARFDA